MPIHDWTRVNPGLFHHFHHGWTAALSNALNAGGLPPGYFALSEQIAGGLIPDVLTLQQGAPTAGIPPTPSSGGIDVATAAPRTKYILRADADPYVAKANRVTIRHPLGHVVAVIEIVSPGNKDSRAALGSFVGKAVEFLRLGIHLLIVDLFPPSARDPRGIHKAIWDEIQDAPFEPPADKPLTLASYAAGFVKVAYVEPVAVGDLLPEMPLFLEPETYVPAPLESTYQSTWESCPLPLREALA